MDEMYIILGKQSYRLCGGGGGGGGLGLITLMRVLIIIIAKE
jgi:hypothetical protein